MDDGQHSDNSELLSSARSSKEFWQEFERMNTKVEKPAIARVRAIAKKHREEQEPKNKDGNDKKHFAFTKWDAELAEKKINRQKQEFEIKVKNIRRLSRRNALEFFLNKSEHVINMFKEQNMHIVKAYHKL